jgi:hypothetical protein
LEVRQRLKAEKEVNRETLDAADPDKTAVKKRKYCREYVAKRKKVLVEINIMMRLREINSIPLIDEINKGEGENDDEKIKDSNTGPIEQEGKIEESENEEDFNEMIEDLIEWHAESKIKEDEEKNEKENRE